jgi:5-hydroxyisourate hydrolase-like protein (transthyretin family)
VALALSLALTLLILLPWATAQGQQPSESPLPTPPPAEAPALAPAQPLVPVVLPSLTGVVRDPAGLPLAGIQLSLYRLQLDQWEVVRASTTNAAGEFRIPWLSAGAYRLALRDPSDTYARTFYPNAVDIEAGAALVLAGNALAPLEITLAPAAQIAGALLWPEGPLPFDTTVNLFVRTPAPITTRYTPFDQPNGSADARQWRLVESKTFTESLVAYTFDGLGAGTYRICAESVSLRTALAECYENAALPVHATSVEITAGQAISLASIFLGDSADTAVISGTLTVADGSPAAGVRVEALPAAGEALSRPTIHTTETDATGFYRLANLPAGRYTLQFSDPRGFYFLSAYRAEPEEIDPTVIELARNDTRRIDAQVVAAGRINGFVTLDGAIPGIGGQVYAYRETELGPVGITGPVVAATGAFTVAGLASDAYWLQLQLPLFGPLFYGGTSVQDAARITVTTGQTVSNVIYDLLPVVARQATGAISGTVTAGNAPRAGIRVEIYGFSPDCCTPPPPFAYALTDEAGRYTLGGLPAGSYKLGFVDPNETLATLYSGNSRIYETATTIQIGDPADGVSRQFVGGVDADLVMAGAVARTVYRLDETPVAGATVRIYQQVGEAGQFPLVATTTTDSAGRYGFIRLVPDTYHLCIAAPGIEVPSCAGRGGTGVGVEVPVEAGALTSGVDVIDAP